MPNVKKVLLQKSISNTLFDIFPKTDASIVQYDKDGTTTTVAAELASLAAEIVANGSSVTDALEAEIQALEDKIYGLADGETLNSAFDTLKEISDFIVAHPNSVAELQSQITTNANAIGRATEYEEDGITVKTVGSGLIRRAEQDEARIAALEQVGSTKVESSLTNGNIKVDGSEMQVYDDSNLWTEVGADNTYNAARELTASGSGLKARISQNTNEINKLQDAVGSDAVSGTIKGRIAALETEVGSDTVAASVKGRITALEAIGAKNVKGKNAGDADGTIRVATSPAGLNDDSAVVTVYAGDPTIIQQDATHRFVTDTEKASWDSTVSYVTSAPSGGSVNANTLYMVDLGA